MAEAFTSRRICLFMVNGFAFFSKFKNAFDVKNFFELCFYYIYKLLAIFITY